MLNREQWSALTDEEKASRVDEKPKELSQQLSDEDAQKLRDDVVSAKEQVENLQKALHEERVSKKEAKETSKVLEDKIVDLEGKINSSGEEDLYLTLNKAKDLLITHSKDVDKKFAQVRDEFARERELSDERRMKALTQDKEKYPISYDEAIKAFAQLAKDSPILYRQVQDAANMPGGRPAELAYKIAVREHPEFMKRIKESATKDVLTNIKQGKPVKLPSGSAGSGKKDIQTMEVDEIMKMSDEEWERAAKGKK